MIYLVYDVDHFFEKRSKMEKENIKLSNSEWYVLQALWEQSPKSLMQLVKSLNESMNWAKSTTTTTIKRMEEKGFLIVEEGEKAKLYYPAVEKEQAVLRETNHFLDKIYNGSVGMMLNTFVQNRTLSPEEIRELHAIIEQAERESGE